MMVVMHLRRPVMVSRGCPHERIVTIKSILIRWYRRNVSCRMESTPFCLLKGAQETRRISTHHNLVVASSAELFRFSLLYSIKRQSPLILLRLWTWICDMLIVSWISLHWSIIVSWLPVSVPGLIGGVDTVMVDVGLVWVEIILAVIILHPTLDLIFLLGLDAILTGCSILMEFLLITRLIDDLVVLDESVTALEELLSYRFRYLFSKSC